MTFLTSMTGKLTVLSIQNNSKCSGPQNKTTAWFVWRLIHPAPRKHVSDSGCHYVYHWFVTTRFDDDSAYGPKLSKSDDDDLHMYAMVLHDWPHSTPSNSTSKCSVALGGIVLTVKNNSLFIVCFWNLTSEDPSGQKYVSSSPNFSSSIAWNFCRKRISRDFYLGKDILLQHRRLHTHNLANKSTLQPGRPSSKKVPQEKPSF